MNGLTIMIVSFCPEIYEGHHELWVPKLIGCTIGIENMKMFAWRVCFNNMIISPILRFRLFLSSFKNFFYPEFQFITFRLHAVPSYLFSGIIPLSSQGRLDFIILFEYGSSFKRRRFRKTRSACISKHIRKLYSPVCYKEKKIVHNGMYYTSSRFFFCYTHSPPHVLTKGKITKSKFFFLINL